MIQKIAQLLNQSALHQPSERWFRRFRAAAWASFVLEVTIIATGGAVRLTGSGLGCSEWPLCTPDSLIPTAELSYHGLIEFGNRMMTGVVGIIAVVVFLFAFRIRKQRPDLFLLSSLVVGGVILQALVGGIVVIFDLDPNLVGFHYIVSIVLVSISAALLVRLSHHPKQHAPAAPPLFRATTYLTAATLIVTIIIGVLTTGAGPHSGDTEAVRNGFDVSILERLHAVPGYVLFVLTTVLCIWSARSNLLIRNWAFMLLIIEFVQIGVGLYQAWNGLPAFAVGVHMVLASLTAATMTVLVLLLKQPGLSTAERNVRSKQTDQSQ